HRATAGAAAVRRAGSRRERFHAEDRSGGGADARELNRPAVTFSSSTWPALKVTAGRLSSRERQVLALLALGHSSREIGLKLSVSPRTVDEYRARLKGRL